MHCNTPVAIVILSGGNINAARIVGRPEVPSWCVQRKHGSEVVRTVLFVQRLVYEGQDFEIYPLRYRQPMQLL